MAIGSDYGFYGGGSGLSSLLWGGGGGGLGSYLGYSSYLPSMGTGLPSTVGGFLGAGYIPELAGARNLQFQTGDELQDLYSRFRSEGGADPSAFANELLGREDVQGLLERQQYAEGTPYIRTEQGQGLEDVVSQLLGEEGSLLSNLYGAAGVGAGAATEDIRRLMAGEQSSIGDLAGYNFFGNAGELTGAGREAVAAQLLQGAGGLVNLGGSRAFNPLSGDLLTDEYNFTLGQGGQLGGTELLRLTSGLASMQDLDITSGIAGAFRRAVDTGADLGFGGGGAFNLTQALANLNLGEGQAVTQYATTQAGHKAAQQTGYRHLGQWIDRLYGGQAGSDFGQDFSRLFQANLI